MRMELEVLCPSASEYVAHGPLRVPSLLRVAEDTSEYDESPLV